jgi:hypothetical protein
MEKLPQCIRLSVEKKNILKMFLVVLILIFYSPTPSRAQDCVTYVYPSYSSPLYFDFSGTGSGVIGVSLANSQCGFSYYTTADWITVTRAPNTYTRLSVTCSANTTGVNRSGIIWIDKYGVQVVQYPQLAAPIISTVTSITESSFTANWSSVTNAAGYWLDVSTNSSFTGILTGYNNLFVSGTSQTVAGLSPNTNYYYRVRAYSSSYGTSNNSATANILTTFQAPAAVNATAIAVSSFIANWSAVPGAASYRLDVSTSSDFLSFVGSYNNYSVTASSQTISSLSAGTTYYYRVRAVNASGASVNSNTITVLTLPAAPTLSATTNLGPNSFTINWGGVQSATEYRLDVSTTETFLNFVTGYNNLQVTATSMNVTGLNPNTTYYFRVRAVNGTGTSGNSFNGSTLTLLLASTANAATSVTASSFSANWSAVAGAASYRLDVSTSSDFSSFVGSYNNYSVSATSQAISSLSAGTTYYYRVRAVNASGASVNSNIITVLTLPAAPTLSSVTNLGTNSFTLNWGGVQSATEYRLDISTSDAFSNFVAGYNNLQVSSTSINVAGLSSNTTYYYRVRAVNGTGTSANSANGSSLTLSVAPTANAATIITTSSFNANWSAVSGTASYRLDVSTSNSFSSFVGSYNNYSVSATSQAISSLSAGTTYYYRVRAVNASGASANSNTITVLTLPAAPSLSISGTIQASSLTVAWGSITSATGYQLDVSTNSTFSSMVPSYNNLAVAGTSKVISGLYPLVTYYIRLRAVNATGSSTNSNIVSASTIDNNGNYNYIKTAVMQEPCSDMNLVNTLPVESRAVDIAFYDGLGRPMQVVSWQATPGKSDLIQPIAYDAFGRESIKYLPYTDAVADGSYRTNAVNAVYSQSDQYKFYHNGFSNTSAITLDDSAYSRTVFEPSPLNRVIQQGAPGAAWQPSAGHASGIGYMTNTATEVKQWCVNSAHQCVLRSTNAGNYDAGELYVNQTKDENGNRTKEYKDKEGRVVLKKSYIENDSLQTYYVYDDFGLLRYVIPPKAVKVINMTSFSSTHAYVRQLCYYYRYDERNRMTLKQLPGVDSVLMVYDARDRLVASQDGNQRKTGEWLFTKYDAFNRPVMSGVFKPAKATRQLVQSAVDSFYNKTDVNWYTERSNESTLTNTTGYYLTRSYPESVTESNLRSLTYYDNYDTIPGLRKFVAVSELGATVKNIKVKGQVTATRVKVLDGSNTWITSTNYYDDKYRVIQTVKNNYINGEDRLTTRYDFVGKVMQTRLEHTGLTGKQVDKTFEYDHAGRLLKIFHSVDGSTPVLMSYMKYNELGQLVDKKLHVTDQVNDTYVQSIDYRYNIRGWLKSINNPGLTNDSGTTNDDTTDKFGMKLMYNNN